MFFREKVMRLPRCDYAQKLCGLHHLVRLKAGALEYYNAYVVRTTIELKEEHRALLHALAARRGWRGYSKVVQEAIEFYLAHHAEAEEARRTLLLRKGAWTLEEAARTRAAIAELRKQWAKTSS